MNIKWLILCFHVITRAEKDILSWWMFCCDSYGPLIWKVSFLLVNRPLSGGGYLLAYFKAN